MTIKNRIKLIEKMDAKIKYEPTAEELESAYGYLSYCNDCGKKIKFLEAYSHGTLGNWHKFGCSSLNRLLGRFYTIFLVLPIRLLIIIILLPIGLVIYPFIILKRVLLKEKRGGWQ